MSKPRERVLAFVFGTAFLSVMLVIAIAIPEPTYAQFTTFKIVLAVAAAATATMIPGFLQVEVSNYVRAGGALAVFVVVFFFSPAGYVSSPPPAQGVALNALELGVLDGEVTAALEFEIVEPTPGALAFVELDENEAFQNPLRYGVSNLASKEYTLALRRQSGDEVYARIAVTLGKRTMHSNVRNGVIR